LLDSSKRLLLLISYAASLLQARLSSFAVRPWSNTDSAFPSYTGSSIIWEPKGRSVISICRLVAFRTPTSLFFRKDVSVVDEDQDKILSRDERRQFDRSRLIVDVYFDGSDLTGVASTTDISLGGLYLSTGVDIPKGSTLTLRIPMGRQHLVVRGDVVYSLPGHGVGVRFHRLSSEKRALMERELPAP
jgi:hypothetical protein